MKKLLGLVVLGLLVGLGLVARSLTAEVLPVPGAASAFAAIAPQPPEGMRVAEIEAGKMLSQAAFAYRGGKLSEPRVFNMGGFLVVHPQGTLLFDAGFGSKVDEHFKTVPWLMRATSRYEKEATVASQLQAAGIAPSSLKAVVLTHAHWDHISGVDDLRGVPVWVTQAELDFIRSGDDATALARKLGDLPYHVYDFPGGAYLGFERSHDVFGDGSVVLVPAPGHTPGSIIAFVHTPDGKHYALIGDLAWQSEGVDIPAQRPWLSRRLVDHDEAAVSALLVKMHQLKGAMPDLIVVPAHDRRVADALPKL